MVKINIIRPPRVNVGKPKGGFWRQIGMIIIGTTISLSLTLLVAKLSEDAQRAKDRRLSAMMVMSNIEKFCRILDDNAEHTASADSIATWLVNKPIEELELMPEDELAGIIEQAFTLFFLSYDKSAENIFSNHIDTWKNMGNVQFIDQVGQCFSAMHSIEEYWNKRMGDVDQTYRHILDHPEEYEGINSSIKVLRSDKMRRYFEGISNLRAWLSYSAAIMRYHNRRNMESIGITEQEVMEYTNAREMRAENSNDEPSFSDFNKGSISIDSLTTLRGLDVRLEELKREDSLMHK